MSRKTRQKSTPRKGASLQVRIIGGKWKGRKLNVTGNADLRPTPGRSRETLFNWLRAELIGSRCLDLFAGTGALGLEALSQGAGQVTLVENNPQTCQSLAKIIEALGSNADIRLVQSDAIRFLKQSAEGKPPPAWDIVFLDPPFQRNELIDAAMVLLHENALAGEYIYLEAATAAQINQMAERYACTVYRTTRAGDSHAALLRPHKAC
ncbi:MAG: 16S rRNA (guanine(966)-N(2))-methyltransferase RsmD [Pseudomonadota bacterium]